MGTEVSSEVNPCDLCGGTSASVVKEARPYIGDNDPPVICRNCGFVYVVQRRSSEEIARAWDEIWGEGYTSKWPMVQARQFYVAEWFEQMFGWQHKDVLDIGAGEGHFMHELQKRHAFVMGIDPDPKHHKPGYVINSTIEDYYTRARYDIITILWTLENCGDCIGMLRKARELLKPGGCVVVATGSRILVPFKKPLSTYFSENPADTHCFRFSANSLRAAFSIAGLSETQTNNFLESDWLVCVGREGKSSSSLPYDHPDAVADFFKEWARLFP